MITIYASFPTQPPIIGLRRWNTIILPCIYVPCHLRALGILIHEMLNGEPPFGYGGDDLPHRIAAGLPKQGNPNVAAPCRDAFHPEEHVPTAQSDTDGSTDGDTYDGTFLPIVR